MIKYLFKKNFKFCLSLLLIRSWKGKHSQHLHIERGTGWMAESFARFAKSTSQNGFAENVTGKFVRYHSLRASAHDAAKWVYTKHKRVGTPMLFGTIRLIILSVLTLSIHQSDMKT